MLSAVMSDFPVRLRALMERARVNQVELAKRTGLNQSNISQYLKGSVEPTLDSLLSLTRALRCTLEEITGLPALHGAESKIPKLSEDAVKFGTFFESLADGDPLKEYLRKLIAQSDSHDKNGGDAA